MKQKPFNDEFLKKLELLRIAVRKSTKSSKEGDIHSKQIGSATDFISHRDYSPGDETRYIDWNVYARLEALFIKQFSKDVPVVLNLIIDSSSSMSFGKPSKFDLAKKIGVVLGYVALSDNGELAIYFAGHKEQAFRHYHGVGDIASFFSFIDSINTNSGSGLTEALNKLLAPSLGGRKGTYILLSDLWDDRIEDKLALVKAVVGDFSIIHLLSNDEVDPQIAGIVSLIDCETSRAKRLYISQEEQKEYKHLLNEHFLQHEQFCASHEINYVRVISGMDIEQVIFIMLRKAGIIS